MKKRSETPKSGHKQSSSNPAKALRDARIRELAAEGHTMVDIAKTLGLERKTIAAVLNNDDTKEIVRRAETRLSTLVDLALDAVQDALGDQDIHARLKSAFPVLKSVGVIKDRVDLSHSFPEPVVIRRASGERVILGTKADVEEDSSNGE